MLYNQIHLIDHGHFLKRDRGQLSVFGCIALGNLSKKKYPIIFVKKVLKIRFYFCPTIHMCINRIVYIREDLDLQQKHVFSRVYQKSYHCQKSVMPHHTMRIVEKKKQNYRFWYQLKVPFIV